MSENTTRDQNLPLLKVNDLHVYYGAIHAVKGISLEVHARAPSCWAAFPSTAPAPQRWSIRASASAPKAAASSSI